MAAKPKNPKPPVVVILGHVDHGKTTLLDYIRKTKVAEKESGGITQHIGAYEIIHHDKKITFLDTPGHEAFSAIRSRGASNADIAVLVIAADEGIKPQTKESFSYIKAAKIPFLVALNKIDRPTINIERIKKSIVEGGISLEGMGGDVPYVEISAKTGKGVNELLDFIVLLAELHPKNINPDAAAEGVIIETHLHSRKGNIVSVIVQNGTLRKGDNIATPTAQGKVRRLEDENGETISKAQPSKPVLVFGFEKLPLVGEIFKVVTGNDVKKAQEDLKKKEAAFTKEKISPEETAEKKIKLIIKADATGSLEAIEKTMKEFPEVFIIEGSLGDFSDGDVKLAQATGALIVLFRVKTSRAIANLVLDTKVPVISSDVIYELKDKIEEFIKSGQATAAAKENIFKVIKIFSRTASKATLGGSVESGRIKVGDEIEIIRENKKIGRGKILNLQVQKKDVTLVSQGNECGLFLATKYEVMVGDMLKTL